MLSMWGYHHHPEAVGTVIPVAAAEPMGAVRDIGEIGLGAARRAELAIALHLRWHGERTPEPGKALTAADQVECARLAGAFDDVAAIEPLILGYIAGGAS